MGNRATIILTDGKSFSPAVYVHWNGGAESVYQFLDELDRRKISADPAASCARLIQIIGEFFDSDNFSALSLYVYNGPESASLSNMKPHDPGDNGIFLVDRLLTPRRVRRFSARSSNASVKEWSELQVEQERLEAYKHAYFADGGFRTIWQKQHGDKPTEYEKLSGMKSS